MTVASDSSAPVTRLTPAGFSHPLEPADALRALAHLRWERCEFPFIYPAEVWDILEQALIREVKR